MREKYPQTAAVLAYRFRFKETYRKPIGDAWDDLDAAGAVAVEVA